MVLYQDPVTIISITYPVTINKNQIQYQSKHCWFGNSSNQFQRSLHSGLGAGGFLGLAEGFLIAPSEDFLLIDERLLPAADGGVDLEGWKTNMLTFKEFIK